MHFRMQSLPSMLSSFTVTGTASIIDRLVAVKKFFSFCYGELRDTYLAKLSPVYHADYENLVLTGRIQQAAAIPLISSSFREFTTRIFLGETARSSGTSASH